MAGGRCQEATGQWEGVTSVALRQQALQVQGGGVGKVGPCRDPWDRHSSCHQLGSLQADLGWLAWGCCFHLGSSGQQGGCRGQGQALDRGKVNHP